MRRKSIPVSVREFVIERDNATCQLCGKVGTRVRRGGKPAVVEYTTARGRLYDGSESVSFHIHHKTPVFLNGSNDPENLELRCSKCNHRDHFAIMARNYLETFGDTKFQNVLEDLQNNRIKI